MVALDARCFSVPFRFGHSAMRSFAEAANAWSYLAVSDGDVCGFCITHLEQAAYGSLGYLVTIDVSPEYRRRGVGELMLAAAEAWLSGTGAGMMLLHVFTENTGAIRFYRNAGYRRVREESDFYGPGMHAAVYLKELD